MNHYDKEDIKNYIAHNISDDMSFRMEEHFRECDECLNVYLSLIENNIADDFESPDFVDSVMKEINIEKKTKRRKRMSEIFIYYTAAAAVTLFFAASGMFQPSNIKKANIFNMLNTPSGSIEKVLMNGWSQRLLNSTSNIMKDIKNPGRNINE